MFRNGVTLFLAMLLLATFSVFAGGTKEDTVPAEGSSSVKEKEPVVITYLTQVVEYPKYQDEINEVLHKQYPNITVEIQHIADNYDAVLKTKLASGQAPDIFSYEGYFTAKPFVEGDQVLDLTDDDLDELIYKNFRSSGVYEGGLYSIPTNLQGFGLIYNKEAFREAGISELPKTLSELKEVCEKLLAVGITPFGTGFKDVWVNYIMMWGIQGPVLEDFRTFYEEMNAGTRSFYQPELDEAFELFDLVVEYGGDKPLSSGYENMCHLLGAKEVGMIVMGDWAYPEILKVNPDAEIGMSVLPISDNPADATLVVDVGESLYISSQTQHPEEAKDFIRFMLSKEGAEVTCSIRKNPSTSIADPEIPLSPLAQDVADLVKAGVKTCGFMRPFWVSGLADIMGKDLQNYIAGSMTRKEFYSHMDESWKKLSGN